MIKVLHWIQVQRKEKINVPVRQRKQILPVSTFCFASTDWARATHLRESNLLNSVYWFKNLIQKTLINTSRILFNQKSPSGWYMKLTITLRLLPWSVNSSDCETDMASQHSSNPVQYSSKFSPPKTLLTPSVVRRWQQEVIYWLSDGFLDWDGTSKGVKVLGFKYWIVDLMEIFL